ncbi:MAG: pyrroline-5-carboxylate reductase [Pseudomonadota bacterium]
MHTLATVKITLIGGGNMGRGLIGGLLAQGVPAQHITVADPHTAGLDEVRQLFGVRTTADNDAAVRAANVVVLAVKPQQLASVVAALRGAIGAARPLLLSVAAGIRAADLARWAGAGIAVVRAMPNRPALVGAGATALYAAADVTDTQRALAQQVMSATGLSVWVDEEAQIDVVTALSGSGPAYFFLLAELMARAATARGLPAATAQRLAAQTLAGAGLLVAGEKQPDLAAMRIAVTSKGGTTEAALSIFESQGLAGMVAAAQDAAADRSRELADEFGAT